MSWFDTAGFANIAKTALKEAQRTIDKALDIKEETIVPPANTPIDTNSDDFFGSWGVSSSGNDFSETKLNNLSISPSKQKSSIWGSFTGSFFDPYAIATASGHVNIQPQPRDSVDSLDDSLAIELFTESKLVVQPSDENCDGESLLEVSAEEIKCNNEDFINSESGQKSIVINNENNVASPDSIDIITSISSLTTPDSEAVSSNSITQITTESIEVIQNNVTSPSSIEVISNKSNLISTSVHNNESVLGTPDSVELIPEDLDDSSIADETISLTSMSETTAYENMQFIQKPIIPTHVHVNKDSESSTNLEEHMKEIPITRAPSRYGMHLPLQQISVSNIIDFSQDAQETSMCEGDSSTISDKTLVGSDNIMESSSDTSTTTDSNTSSLYLKNMIADAMSEKRSEVEPHFMDLTPSMLGEVQGPNTLQNLSISQLDMPPREMSPISSESRSDLVKVGSDQTSGHTSGDEIETTTSSDIEVISSPNGDSSSTQSRHSPSKLSTARIKSDGLPGKFNMKKVMGHHRELSQVSNVSDDAEVEKLLKRLAEVTEILELRENKIIENTRKLAEMQDLNSELQKQLDIVINKQVYSEEITEVTDKYAQRLSALEKKFQQAIREKDLLRKQLEQCKEDNAVRMSKSELDGVMEEKDQIIQELRQEGEKLSKQQLQHSNIIKKLRIKEKENEQTIKYLKESIEDLSSEAERLKRSLSAKEEVERSQIEAIHQLTAKNKKLEYEVSQIQGSYDDLSEKYETIKKSFEVAKKELIDKNKTSNELLHREHLLETLENSKRMTESQNQEILSQLEDLRLKIREVDQESLTKEQKYRSETAELMRRLENAESRNEELSQSLLDASKPLVRQLELLQGTYNAKVSSFEKIEQNLTMKISELRNKLQSITDSTKLLKEECSLYKNKMSNLQLDVDSLSRENEQLKVQINQANTTSMLREQELNKEIEILRDKLATEVNTIENQQKIIESIQYNLNVERSNHEKEKKRLQEIPLQQLQQEVPFDCVDIMTKSSASCNVRADSSPTLSVGRVSLSESMNSSLWPDDSIDLNSVPRCTNILEMQLLQTNLKQRDGDVQQMQWELNRREHERTLLNNEISQLLTKVEELQSKTNKFELMQKELLELKQQYETLCQLYGEKVEENEELKLDLLDVKEMYKAQIDELLKQQRNDV